ncbi:hypothetical protein [Salinicola salarius]|jgi:hypothetical protein|uniref:hypothetical protein n=1 Tax=Salinicola salarius TaxID=430457 RepID=UPI000B3F8CC6|nr:hypothetical protein [Salinicola salarius]
MTDQAAGLRAWAAPGTVPLGVIGEPDDEGLMQALAQLPAPAGRRWQVTLEAQAASATVRAWVLWVDAAQVDVADLYRRVKRTLAPVASSAGPAVPLLLWVQDAGNSGARPTLDAATAQLLTNLGTTLRRFLNIELIRDLADWQRRLPEELPKPATDF